MRDLIDLVERTQSPLSSPTFKAWFQGSKAVDQLGQPMVFYHGSPRGNDITQFEHRPTDGIYFTNDREYAQSYAVEFRAADSAFNRNVEDDEDGFAGDDITGSVYPVYLRILNPYVMSEHDEDDRSAYVDHGFNREDMIAKGFDGIFLIYDDGEVEAQAFYPNQIKSVFNNGAYSQSGHIGESLTEAFDRALPYQWADHTNEDMSLLQASFQVGDGLFIVQFKAVYYNRNTYEISFTRNGTLDLTGTGSASRVLATVMAAIREFVRDVDPLHIEFAGKTDEPSRNKLYPKLMAMLQREFPQYVADQPRAPGRGTYMNYGLSRPRREWVPPVEEPQPEPEPVKDVTPEEWDEIEAYINDLQAERSGRRAA